jgi:hypothetical protein
MSVIRKTKYESVNMDFLDNPEIWQDFIIVDECTGVVQLFTVKTLKKLKILYYR